MRKIVFPLLLSFFMSSALVLANELNQPSISEPKNTAERLLLGEYLRQQRLQGASERLLASQQFLAENAKRKGVITTKSGVQYEILDAGNGPKPTELDSVVVNYRQAKLNADLSYRFDESSEQVIYALRGDVPAGWLEVFMLMNKGARYRVFVPPALGYGIEGLGEQILPNEMLINEFTLIDIIPPPAVNY
jgi:FKBP-type peptidyl-prolyl cis-trans isomerase FklB